MAKSKLDKFKLYYEYHENDDSFTRQYAWRYRPRFTWWLLEKLKEIFSR